MLLEEAIKSLQDLPEEEQDFAADIIFVYLASEERGYRRTPSPRASKRRPTNL
jgi:hypothetical protein